MKREKVLKDWLDSILAKVNVDDDDCVDIGQVQFLIDQGYDPVAELKRLSEKYNVDYSPFLHAKIDDDEKQYNIRTFFFGLFVSIFCLIGIILLVLNIIRG